VHHIGLVQQALALATIGSSLVLCSCGGAAKSTSSAHGAVSAPQPGVPLSQSALVSKADEICARMIARRAKVHIRSEQDFTRLLPPLVAYERKAADELQALTPPSGLAGDWQEIVAGFRTLAADTAKFGEYATSGRHEAQKQLLLASQGIRRKTAAALSRDGLTVCPNAV
jgi:hypothetical protein